MAGRFLIIENSGQGKERRDNGAGAPPSAPHAGTNVDRLVRDGAFADAQDMSPSLRKASAWSPSTGLENRYPCPNSQCIALISDR